MEIIREITENDIICRTGVWNGGFLPFHWHDNIEICRLCNKPADFLIDGEVVHADVDDIVVVRERSVHQFIINNDDTRIRLMQISPKALISFSSVIKPVKKHITSAEIADVPNFASQLDALFDIVNRAGGSPRIGDVPYAETAAATIYFMLMNYFPGEAGSDSDRERRMFYDMAEFVNLHFTEDISVQSVALALYIPRGRAGAIFTKYAGTTLGEYINTLRINDANRLMKSGKSIAEAAYESGFQNIRTFNAVYKKVIGMTPSEYVRGISDKL